MDPSKGLEYDNIALIRAFEHGLDRTSSEAGFVLVHVDMVRDSGGLIRGVLKALQAVESDDRSSYDDGLEETLDALRKVNKTMDSTYRLVISNDFTF